MTPSKTLDLLEKVRLGDEQAKEEIVKENLGLVWSIVHRFKNSYYDKEDLFLLPDDDELAFEGTLLPPNGKDESGFGAY